MSGTAGVPNLFAAAVTATGAQLDANYSTVVAYLNDPTNRNNFATDGAATNTVALTFSPAVVGGYSTGLELTWKWGTTNSGGVVLNANGLGNVSLVNADGTALSAGQGQVGSIGKGIYDGTRFIFITPTGTPASAAQVSAAATLVPYVSPGRMQNHPGVAKAWAVFNGTITGTITASSSYNISSIVRTGTGSYTITLVTPMSSPPPGIGILTHGTVVGAMDQTISANTNTFGIVTFASNTGAQTDRTYIAMIVFGNQ